MRLKTNPPCLFMHHDTLAVNAAFDVTTSTPFGLTGIHRFPHIRTF
jgi:hypothetical protein